MDSARTTYRIRTAVTPEHPVINARNAARSNRNITPLRPLNMSNHFEGIPSGYFLDLRENCLRSTKETRTWGYNSGRMAVEDLVETLRGRCEMNVENLTRVDQVRELSEQERAELRQVEQR